MSNLDLIERMLDACYFPLGETGHSYDEAHRAGMRRALAVVQKCEDGGSATGKILKFTIPLVPPSVNHYKVRYRTGRTVVSQEAIAFKDAVAIFIRGRYVQAKRFSVTIHITLGKGDKGDWDNYAKLPMDGLAAAGAFRDLKGKWLSDAHVKDGRVILDCDTRPERGFTEITIEPL